MTNATDIYGVRQGEKVRGSYHGEAYSGTVESVRLHTMNHNLVICDVALDAPITVFGMARFNINVYGPNDPHMSLTVTR